jgi:hypothetical protein
MFTITIDNAKRTEVTRPDAHSAVRDISASFAHDLKAHVPHEALPTTLDELVRLCVRMNWPVVIRNSECVLAVGDDPRKV